MSLLVFPLLSYFEMPTAHQLDLSKPSVQEHVSNKQLEQKKHYDVCSKDCFFQIGQPVRNFWDGPKWVPGHVSVREGPVTYGVEGSQWSTVEAACYQILDQRRRMAEQPATSITGLSNPELPCDPVVNHEICLGTSATNSETPSGKLDGPLEDSKETSDSMISNSPVPQRYPQRFEGHLNDSNQVSNKDGGMWCTVTLLF